MQKLLPAICVLIIGAALGAGALWLNVRGRLAQSAADSTSKAHESNESAEPGTEAPRLSRSPEGETVVHFDTETQMRVALKTVPLVAATHQPETVAYGLFEEDPAQSFVLRAPVAGVVRAGESAVWPDLDHHLDAGVLLGYVEPRLTQTEKIDLASRLTQARADAAEAEAALATARSSYENKKKLNAENKAVSDRALEEALSKVKGEEARLGAAVQIVQLIENAQSGAGVAATRFELRTAQPGQVVETPVRPGEAVEAGQVLLRTVRFDTLVARVELPVGTRYDEGASDARFLVVGDEDQQLTGARIGLATAVGTGVRGSTLLFRVPTAGRSIRPGAAVVAYLSVPGGARAGAVVPRGAVIRLLGKAWAYAQTDDESFTRRELDDAEPLDAGWFVTRGFQPGERVVTDGAQVLLSEELKAQIEREDVLQK